MGRGGLAATRVAVQVHVPEPAASGPVSSVITDAKVMTSHRRAKTLVVASLVGVSQTELAEATGVGQSYVARWVSSQSDALPNLGHLVSEGGPWAATVARLILAEVETVDATKGVASVEAKILGLLEAVAPLFRALSLLRQRGDLTPADRALVLRALGEIMALGAQLQLSLARGGQ